MKLVHCLFTMESGGAQVLTVGLLNEMCIHHEVVLIIVNDWNAELLKQLHPSIKIHYLHRKEGSRSWKPFIRLNLLLMKYNADIIHCHEPNMAGIIRWRKKAKLFYTVHDMGIPVTWHNKYDCLIAISEAVYLEVVAQCITPPVIQIDNGIPVALFRRRTDYEAVTSKPVRLVQLSRLQHEKKGQDILLKSLQYIIQQYGCTNWTLDFIGAGVSESYLRQLTGQMQLQNKVRLVGEKDREWILNHLCDYHILIQPSRYEGFGLTIVEGLVAGLPVLASDIDGPKNIIDVIDAGLLFENGNITDCGNQLYKLIQLWQQGRAGAAMQASLPHIEARYAITACATRYMNAYQNAVHAAGA